MKELIARIDELVPKLTQAAGWRIPYEDDEAESAAKDCADAARLLTQLRDALEKTGGDAERVAALDKANVDLAAESSKLRGLLSDLVDAVDAMEDLDEMDGEAFSTNSAKLDAAVEAARPHTEAALLAAAKLRSALRALDEA